MAQRNTAWMYGYQYVEEYHGTNKGEFSETPRVVDGHHAGNGNKTISKRMQPIHNQTDHVPKSGNSRSLEQTPRVVNQERSLQEQDV